jgi:hypothetical protein
MAIYDIGATASTAVTAFLSQFKISANGDIRYVSGTDTFHTWWLHRALQKIAWDFAISGDDELNLTKPNPSTSEAIGTIITLQDHTTAYSVNYNITTAEAEYLFGGSIEQNNGDDRFSGLIVLGSVASPTQLQIIQDNGLLTSHWGTGKNQTDSSTLIRILIQTRSSGADIDGQRVLVKANEWGDTYASWRTSLGLGEKVAAINTSSDPQNSTALATVQAYIGITNTEGHQLLDIGDGSGNKPYLSKWDYGSNNKKALYEWVKSVMVRGSSATIYGLDGDFFVGPTMSFDYDGEAGGPFTEPEQITWAAGSGQLMAVRDDGTSGEMWVQILTGVNPSDNDTITGVTSGATCAVNGSVTSLIPNNHFIGQFTGSSWIGAFGLGFNTAQLTSSDSLSPLDGSGPLSPPNNVPISVSTNGATAPHVFLAIKDGATGGVDQTQYTAASGNNSGNGTFVINEAIASDTPPTGSILVLEDTTFEQIEYSSWSGSTFTLSGTLSQNYTAGKNVIVPILYTSATGGSDPRVASTSLIYSSDIDVVGWVRHGDPASPDKPVSISGTIGTAGLSLTVQLDNE